MKFIAVPSLWVNFVHELVGYINMHIPLFIDVVYTQVHCCHNMLFISLDYLCTMCGVC